MFYLYLVSQTLLSVGQMLERDYDLHFENMRWTIFDPVDVR